MSNQNLTDTPEFKTILCLDFKITYYNKKSPGGFPIHFDPNEPGDYDPKLEIYFNRSIDFWDFSLSICDFQQDKICKNYKHIHEKYHEYRKKVDEDFFKKVLELRKIVDSKHTHLTILHNILDLLYYHKQGFNKIERDPEHSSDEMNTINDHRNVKIITNDKKKHFQQNLLLNFVLSGIIYIQKENIKQLINFLNDHIETIKASPDFIYDVKNIERMENNLHWNAKDTDLLELLVALLETGSISGRNNKSLSRKKALLYFEEIFSMKIKDSESKLSRATERKKDTSPFLSSLKTAFDNYSRKKLG